MHRAKHRAAGSASAEVLATTLIERFAVAPDARPASSGARHGVATMPAPAADPPAVGGPELFGAAPRTAPMLAVSPDDEVPSSPAGLFGGDEGADALVPRPRTGDSPLFGASRHARRGRNEARPAVPAPRVPALPFGPLPSVRPQPLGAALSVTVLGAAAAVTAVVAPPPTTLETTGSLAPVQGEAPAPAPALPVGPALTVPAPLALPDQPRMRVDELVTEVTAEMDKVERPYETVAHASKLTSPAAMRKAAVTNALAKLGTPYRWGAMGPNAFDCSGLVKWSFANAGKKNLPRTSRALATVGVAVKKADLQPGDLVFFYKPISHVGIYIGNGKIVHASRKGQPVKISDMARMKFNTARRV
jgi:cell wall-associated NlpC family hydrolase